MHGYRKFTNFSNPKLIGKMSDDRITIIIIMFLAKQNLPRIAMSLTLATYVYIVHDNWIVLSYNEHPQELAYIYLLRIYCKII